MIAARRPSCRTALLAALASAILAAAPGTPARALVATPDVAAAEAAGPVSTAALGARCIGPAFDDTAAFQAAIDTGHTVYAPALGGQCHITHALVMRTPGQIFHGDGRARTKIVIDPGFTGEGVFVAKTGGPGPTWRDIAIIFTQPDSDNVSKLHKYPTAFRADDTPDFAIQHVSCMRATSCVSLRGNSGNSLIEDFEFSAFDVGIDIDGALDTIRIIDPHWWPFGLSKLQQTIFYKQTLQRPTGLRVGRADDLQVRGGLFLGGQAIVLYESSVGAVGGNIVGTDFDSTSGIDMSAGSLIVSAAHFTLGFKDSLAIRLSKGNMTIVGCYFFVTEQTEAPVIRNIDGYLSFTGNDIETNWFDIASIDALEQSSNLISSNRFGRSPGRKYEKATISLRSNNPSVVTSNMIGALSGGSGVFIESLMQNTSTTISLNSYPGWSNSVRKR